MYWLKINWPLYFGMLSFNCWLKPFTCKKAKMPFDSHSGKTKYSVKKKVYRNNDDDGSSYKNYLRMFSASCTAHRVILITGFGLWLSWQQLYNRLQCIDHKESKAKIADKGDLHFFTRTTSLLWVWYFLYPLQWKLLTTEW